ncbi:MAG: flgD [Bacteriovoracaceae bacterium]|nr:flgD [Bacteriovoracaceae bacterium]
MNTDVTSLQNATATGNGAAKPASQSMGKDDFMKLLLTQLSAQDPLNPQDPTQFVTQLTQFSNLENLQNLGTKMGQLVTANSISLLGKDVRVNGNQINGPATGYYALTDNAKSVNLQVIDSVGNIVKTIKDLPTTPGLHDVKIDGIPAGNYTFSVTAIDVNNQLMNAGLSVGDRVKGVNFSDSTSPILLMDSGAQMKSSDLVEIHDPATTVATMAPTTTP